MVSYCIVAGYKFRFVLGVHGYEFLRATNYPLPGYSTLTERMRNLRLNFGVFKGLKLPLISKLENSDKFCVLSLDEMYIDSTDSFNKNTFVFNGKASLGPSVVNGDQLLLVIFLRGVMCPWKQVIGCHVTSSKTKGSSIKKFIEECINFAEEELV